MENNINSSIKSESMLESKKNEDVLDIGKSNKKSGFIKVRFFIVIGVFILFLLLFFIVLSYVNRNKLRSVLEGQCFSTITYDSNEDGTILTLKFTDDEIIYSGFFGVLGEKEIATLDYTVTKKDEIEISDGVKIKVLVRNDIKKSEYYDGVAVSFSPDFTGSVQDSQLWLRNK